MKSIDCCCHSIVRQIVIIHFAPQKVERASIAGIAFGIGGTFCFLHFLHRCGMEHVCNYCRFTNCNLLQIKKCIKIASFSFTCQCLGDFFSALANAFVRTFAIKKKQRTESFGQSWQLANNLISLLQLAVGLLMQLKSLLIFANAPVQHCQGINQR